MPLYEFYNKGETVVVDIDFQLASTGAYVDPATVRLLVRKPVSGLQPALTYGTDNALVKDSTGRYHVDLVVNESGSWSYRWEGTGANAAAVEDSFTVRDSAF